MHSWDRLALKDCFRRGCKERKCSEQQSAIQEAATVTLLPCCSFSSAGVGLMAFRSMDPNPAVRVQDVKLRVIFSVPLRPSSSVLLLPSTLSCVLPDAAKALGLSKLSEQEDAVQPKRIFQDAEDPLGRRVAQPLWVVYSLSSPATTRLAGTWEAAETCCSLFWCNSSHFRRLAATESSIGFSFVLTFTKA